MNASIPPLVQEHGVPFDVFIQALTEQLDKAQAAMAVKARVAKMPMTFAVTDVSLNLRAFVSVIEEDIFIRPAQPGDSEASTIKLALTTITKPMIEENAVDFQAEEPKFSIRETMGDTMTDEEQRRLERIGVRNINQLTELKRTAGADVIARLARLPVNRLQQALVRAAEPRISHVESEPPPPERPAEPDGERVRPPGRLFLRGVNLMREGRIPSVRAGGREIPLVLAQAHELIIEPDAAQLGSDAEIDFGNGEKLTVFLPDGKTPRAGLQGVQP